VEVDNMSELEYIAQAIFAARRLTLEINRKHGSLKPPIQITARNNPSGWGDSMQISGLLNVAAELTNSEISIVEFTPRHKDNPVNAFVFSTERKAKLIFIADQNNFCWKRFYVCKELCHAVMSDVQSLRTSGAETCHRLITDLLSPALPKEESYPAYETEYAAYLGAIEMLLPPEFFQDIKLSVSLPVYQIALKYMVPRFIIEQVITDGSMVRIIERIRESQAYLNLRLT
jgi:Zn-dependent peptidase ImmA (M78 family)